MQVMQLRSTGQMDHKTAGSILSALQTASGNQRLTLFVPRKATDVVIDRGTVHATYRKVAGKAVAHVSIPEARKRVKQKGSLFSDP